MLKVLGENYFVDLDEIEKYLDMTDDVSVETISGATEMRINIIKFEMVKMMLETILSEHDDIDDSLGLKSASKSGGYFAGISSVCQNVIPDSLLRFL
jgi:hypothetical protein